MFVELRGGGSSTSMAMARKVLVRLTASAPESATTLSMLEMDVTLGESLTIRGRALALFLGPAYQVFESSGIGTEGHAAGYEHWGMDIEFMRRRYRGLVGAVQ